VTGVIESVGDSVGSVGESIGSGVSSGVSSIGSAAGKAKVPALVGTAAAAGIAGGLALGSRLLPKRAAHLNRNGAMKGAMKAISREAGTLGKEIREHGIQVGVGDLAMEVHNRNGSKRRRSPVEVLLQGLTSRRPR
jgi:hypothetical protein